MTIYDAAMRYRQEGVPLVVLGGKEYGSGSSRDWAAKGPALLGVRAVIAESFERIHRSNLVGLGILPLQYAPGESAATAGARRERDPSTSRGTRGGIPTGPAAAGVTAHRPGGQDVAFPTPSCGTLDGAAEVEYYRNGGILQMVLREMLTR